MHHVVSTKRFTIFQDSVLKWTEWHRKKAVDWCRSLCPGTMPYQDWRVSSGCLELADYVHVTTTLGL